MMVTGHFKWIFQDFSALTRLILQGGFHDLTDRLLCRIFLDSREFLDVLISSQQMDSPLHLAGQSWLNNFLFGDQAGSCKRCVNSFQCAPK